MTIKELQEKIKGEFEVNKMKIMTSYIVDLGKSGTVVLIFKDNEFLKCVVDGNEKEKIEKILKN
jgi:hypothetical protein